MPIPLTTKLVTLLPNTGIQFIDLHSFSESELKLWKAPRFAVSRVMADRLAPLEKSSVSARSNRPIDDSPFEEDATDAPVDSGTTASIQADPLKAVNLAQLMHGGWLPLPVSGRTAFWAMLWVNQRVELSGSETMFDLVLAVDTSVTSDGRGGTFCQGDLPNDFQIEPLEPNNFWRSGPVERFVDRSVAAIKRHSLWGQVAEAECGRGAAQVHLAGLFLFLKERGLPVIHIAALPEDEGDSSADARAPIGVTLVVDLGNSRTCGLLVEQAVLPDGKQRFTQLELRRFARKPNTKVTRPFATRLAFVPSGIRVLDGHGTEVATFTDLSVVRLGDDAVEATLGSGADFGVRGMSSPKRYMWDNERRREPWELSGENDSGEPVMIHGDLLCRLGGKDTFKEPEVPEPDQARPLRPAYPRKTGVLLAFVEILEHAYRQANSIEYRHALNRQPGYLRRRIIRQIVIMHPAGMHSNEVQEFQIGVRRAAQLWAEFRTDPLEFRTGKSVPLNPRLLPTPSLQMACDEGFAIQACYLYGETLKRFQESPERLLSTYGHVANGQPKLRMASVDIGGGTIDLAVAEYTLPPEAETLATPAFEVNRLFHDGISRAGDDVARALLERTVFVSIARQMSVPKAKWNELFAPASGIDDPDWAIWRRRLITGLWIPLIHEVIARAETDKPVNDTIGNLLKTPDESAIKELNRRLCEVAGPDTLVKSVKDVRISVTPSQVYGAARMEIGKPLAQYADIIAQFRCDVLIVGGRASAMPAVRRLIMESFPTPPGSIVFLHEQEVGDWFPFAVGGRVGDSKTCAVVGAAIAFQAMHGLGEMSFRDIGAPETDVPNVLGIYNKTTAQLNPSPALFVDGANGGTFRFQHSDVVIGARRIDSPSAMARPVYRVTLDRTVKQRLEQNPVRNQPLVLSVERGGTGSDELHISEIHGELTMVVASGETQTVTDPARLLRAVRCQLQTMLHVDHWLDSGRFEEIEIDNCEDSKSI